MPTAIELVAGLGGWSTGTRTAPPGFNAELTAIATLQLGAAAH